LTVTLWPTLAEAARSRQTIDATACGGLCTSDHEIARIDLGSETGWQQVCPVADAAVVEQTGVGRGRRATLEEMGFKKVPSLGGRAYRLVPLTPSPVSS
jgi:hypothetical protein